LCVGRDSGGFGAYDGLQFSKHKQPPAAHCPIGGTGFQRLDKLIFIISVFFFGIVRIVVVSVDNRGFVDGGWNMGFTDNCRASESYELQQPPVADLEPVGDGGIGQRFGRLRRSRQRDGEPHGANERNR
jgi:hypothetical protein